MHILVHCKKEVFLSLCISKSIESTIASIYPPMQRATPACPVRPTGGRRARGSNFDWTNRKYGKFHTNDGNFIQMMLKYYTRIIPWRNKEKIFPTIFYLSIICKPMNYNILLKLFSINMQIQNKKYIWHEFSDIYHKVTLVQDY